MHLESAHWRIALNILDHGAIVDGVIHRQSKSNIHARHANQNSKDKRLHVNASFLNVENQSDELGLAQKRSYATTILSLNSFTLRQWSCYALLPTHPWLPKALKRLGNRYPHAPKKHRAWLRNRFDSLPRFCIGHWQPIEHLFPISWACDIQCERSRKIQALRLFERNR